MNRLIGRMAFAGLILGSMAVGRQASADVTITAFSNFKSDDVYKSWKSGKIISTDTNYVITATGWGSNYKYIGNLAIDATGCTNVEVDVTLSGPPEADGHLGPVVTFIDGDGTCYSYRWYGQTLGRHVLTMPINAPTVVVMPGSEAGLCLTNLAHLHLGLDPGRYEAIGTYTVSWNNLRLAGGNAAPSKP
jgi:hypothetical protein